MSVPDRWLVLRARTPSDPDARDRVVEALIGMGGRAVWESGPWSVTHLPFDGPPSGPDDAAVDGIEAELRAAADDPDLLVQVAVQEHEAWEELWKVGLEPRRLGDRIVVTPSWKTPETREGDLVITVDPGMAFGNAEHGTTRGCIRLLDGVVREGDRVLDIGAGSAILSIVAALLGATEVLAVESDELAIDTARENADRNGVADRVEVVERRVGSEEVAELGPRDGVMSNIETPYLRPLLPGLFAATQPGGWLLLSGILEPEWEAVRDEVIALGGVFRKVDADGEWRALLFDRPA